MLHKRSIKEKLLKGGAWAFAGKVVTAFTGLGVNALLARLLTPEEFGAYFLAFSLVSLAAVGAQLGLTQAIVRLVSESMSTERYARARMAVRLAVRLAGAGAVLMACVLAFGGGAWVANNFFHSELMSQVMGLVAVWAVLITFQQLMAEVFRGFHDIRLATIFGGLVTSVISMILFFLLWWKQGVGDLHQIILITVIAGGSSVALSSLLLWEKLTDIPFSRNEKISVSEIMHISWPLLVTQLTIYILAQSGLWVMGFFRDPAEVAIYGAALRTVALVAVSLAIVNSVVSPLIAEMYAQGKSMELEITLREVATLAGLPALVILCVFTFYGDVVLQFIFGSYYQAGTVVLITLSIGILVNVWSGSCGLVLMLTGHQQVMMITTVISTTITVMCLFVSVETYGGVGAAVSTVIGVTIQNIMNLLYVKKKVGIWTHIDILYFHKKLMFIGGRND